MRGTVIAITVFIFILLMCGPGFTADGSSSGSTQEFKSMENQKTGLTWRFYYMVKGNRKLPQEFCQAPANDGGNNWRLPSKSEFETLIADPGFAFPSNLSAEYYASEVRNAFGHSVSPEELSQNDPVYLENADALVFDVVKKKWNWRFVTNEYSVACVSPIK